MKREVTAILLIPAVLAALFFAPAPVMLALIAAVALAAQAEACRMTLSSGTSPVVWVSLPLSLLWACALFYEQPFLPAVMATFFLPPVLVLLTRGDLKTRYTAHLLLTTLPIFFGVSMGCLMSLRTHFGNRQGIELLFFLLVLVWGSDSVAYYVGKTVGKRRVAPGVSPNKTVAGTVGLFLAAAALTLAWRIVAREQPDVAWGMLMGLSLGAAVYFGDLLQSLWKRAMGVKDSGTIFPGHGGFWDRCDSLLWAGTALFLWMRMR